MNGDTLRSEFKIEIGEGLGPLAGKIWRIRLMGYTQDNAKEVSGNNWTN